MSNTKVEEKPKEVWVCITCMSAWALGVGGIEQVEMRHQRESGCSNKAPFVRWTLAGWQRAYAQCPTTLKCNTCTACFVDNVNGRIARYEHEKEECPLRRSLSVCTSSSSQPTKKDWDWMGAEETVPLPDLPADIRQHVRLIPREPPA